jgi:hypothetical protein
MNVSTHMRPVSSEKMVRYLDKSIQELEARLEESLSPRKRKRQKANGIRRVDVVLAYDGESKNDYVGIYVHSFAVSYLGRG